MQFFTRPLMIFCTALSLLVSGGASGQTIINVTVGDNFFQPASVTAAPGDSIVFTYTGARTHPVASDNSTFSTFQMSSALRRHTFTLATAGTYGYHCQFHGAPGTGMFGTIVIQPLSRRAEAPAAPTLAVYPNPASSARDERVTVSFTHRAGADARVRLLNVIGRVVRETPLRRAAETAEARVTLDVNNLPAGVYFTTLIVGERAVETRRLVVQP